MTVDTDGMGTLEVATRENEANESDGSITVTVVAEGDGYAVASGDATATVTVGDDDQPVISISADPTNINEGGIARFTLTAEPSPAEPLRVAVSVSQTGDFAASGETGSKTVTVDTDGMGTLEVATRENEANESDGSITVTVVAEGDGYAVASGGRNRDSGPSGMTTSRSSASARTRPTSTRAGSRGSPLTAEPSPAEPLRVAVSVSQTGDFAASGETGSKTVTVDTDGMGTLEVATRENEANESDGSITVTVVAEGDGYAVASGDATATVTVNDTGPSAEEKQAVQEAVAAVAAATVSNVTSNIGARFSAPNTGGASVSLAGVPVVFGQAGSRDPAWPSLADPFDALDEDRWQSQSRSLTGDELLGSSSFEIALGAAEGSHSPDAERQVTVWGRGDFQVFESGGGRDAGYDGDLVAGYLGADFNTGGSWLVGMALSRIQAEADYTLANAEGSGKLEAELTNLHPYVRFAVDDRSEAWTILGLGKGEVIDAAQGEDADKSDLSMQMMSAGARQLLDSFIGLDWALLGDGSLARIETGKGVEAAIDGISASVWRVRAGVEASYTTVWEGGSALTSFLEIAGRQDGGASAEGRGIELSPGLAFSDPGSGFSIEARGRALVLHSADNHREYGASLTASLAPGRDDTGLSLAMTPTWGTPTNSLDFIDASLFARHADHGRKRSDRLSLSSRVSYGFATAEGLLSPFAEFSLHDGDSHRTRVGSRYSLGPAVDMELSGDRMSDGTGSAEHSVQLRARIGF